MTSHTPGPWFVHDFRQASSQPALADITVSCVTPDTLTVCSMGNALTATVEEAVANARLIAAAPDGLAFAIAHDAYLLASGYSGPDSDALHPDAAANWRACRAFIAKATGVA